MRRLLVPQTCLWHPAALHTRPDARMQTNGSLCVFPFVASRLHISAVSDGISWIYDWPTTNELTTLLMRHHRCSYARRCSSSARVQFRSPSISERRSVWPGSQARRPHIAVSSLHLDTGPRNIRSHFHLSSLPPGPLVHARAVQRGASNPLATQMHLCARRYYMTYLHTEPTSLADPHSPRSSRILKYARSPASYEATYRGPARRVRDSEACRTSLTLPMVIHRWQHAAITVISGPTRGEPACLQRMLC